VAGELDLATSPQLRQALGEARQDARLVVLDVREITFIDSAGVHAILDAARDAQREGHQLMLVRGPAHVDRVLALTGVSARISTFELDPTEPAPTLHLTPPASSRAQSVSPSGPGRGGTWPGRLKLGAAVERDVA
jgi:anti-anti-sigma factor